MANTLNLGTDGNWAVKKDSLLAYNSENNNFKPLPFSFNRASSATVVNKAGLIETVGSGEPRIDFSNDAKGALLLEPSRTNSFPDGENVAQTLGVGGATIIQNNNISPKGNLSAAKFTENTSTSSHFARLGSVTAAQSTISVFVKSDGRNRVFLTNDFNNGVRFNVNLGVIDSYVGSGYTASIEDYGNGWYRCIVTTTFSSIATFYLVTLLDDSDSSSYLGDGASSVLLYGAQLEQGSYATSYIPTSGSAVTRLADSCSQTVPDGVIGQTEGTLFVEYSNINFNGTSYLQSLDNGTSSERIELFVYNGNISISVRDNNVQQVNFISNISAIGSNKIAFAYKLNNFVLYINGNQIASDNSGTIPSVNKYNAYGRYDGATGNMSNLLKSSSLYNTRLSNSELAALTS